MSKAPIPWSILEAKLIAHVVAGGARQAFATEFSVGIKSVARRLTELKKAGRLPPLPGGRGISNKGVDWPAFDPLIMRMRADGYDQLEIAAATGLTRNAVTARIKWLKRPPVVGLADVRITQEERAWLLCWVAALPLDNRIKQECEGIRA